MMPFQALDSVGHGVHPVCPENALYETGKTAVEGFCGDQTYLETRGRDVQLNVTFDKVDETEYDALVVSGGRASEYLRGYERVFEIVQHFFRADKPVAAIHDRVGS